MELNDRIRELIAVGASVAANCRPCLQMHVEKARTFGAGPEEVAAAIEIGNRVNKGAADKMETFAADFKVARTALTGEVVMEGNGYQFLGP